jgi:hypothetical protein
MIWQVVEQRDRRMPSLIRLTTFDQDHGALTVVEKGVPFPIKRVFYTYHAPVGTVRGGHSHKRSRMALVAVTGRCAVSGVSANGESWSYKLDEPAHCLVLEPSDWHRMTFEVPGTVLLCFASEEYDPDDYVYQQPKEKGFRH